MSLYQRVRRYVVMASFLIGAIVFMQASLTFSAPTDAITNEVEVYESPKASVAKAKRLATTIDSKKNPATIKRTAVSAFALSQVESEGKELSKGESEGDSFWLTPKGGEFKFKSKPVILEAPQEAVREDVLLKLSTPKIEEPEGFVDVFQLDATNKEGKVITSFERSVGVVVYLEKYNIKEAALSRLNKDGKWERLPATINTDDRVVKTQIDLTGTFALSKVEPESEGDSFWLTEEGGRLEFRSKPIILDVPQGAVREPVLVSLSVNRPALGEDMFDAFILSAQNGEGSPLIKFSKTVTLIASFSEYEAQIPEHRKPGLYKATEKKWEYIPSKISLISPDLPLPVYVEVNHLGTFGMGLAPIEPTYGAQYLPTINGFGNDEFSGNSSVHYPFSLPPTPGGIPFSLGLSYSSESANSIFAGNLAKIAQELHAYKRQASIVGWGWNLSGLGTITRESTGDRRVFLSYAGGRFELKSSGYREWQTEPQAFLKIHSNSNATHNATQWWVWTPDGTRYTFGSPDWGQGVAYNRDILGDGCPQRFRSAHLTEIRDVHGNHIDISYNAEERNVGCSDSIPDLPYTRAIYPQEIKYFPANQTKDSARIYFHYTDDRTDTHVEGYDEYYAQSLWSDSRLVNVTVEVRENDSSYDLSRRYSLEQSYDPDHQTHLYVMRLDKIFDHGTDDDLPLPPWSFDYAYLEPGAQNTTVLQLANNGQGGGVEYQYQRENFLIVPCKDDNNNNAATFRHYVKQKIISDGVGNQTIIDYELQGSGWAHGDGWDAGCTDHFEFGGYGQVQRSVIRNGIVEQKVQTQYHQLVTEDNQNDPSHLSGLSKLQITLDANETELQRSDTTWTVIPNTHGTDWARKDQQTLTTDGVSQITKYYYDPSAQGQGAVQYGNLTSIEEYMLNADGTPNLYRTQETFYETNPELHIVNLPIRQILWEGASGNICQGDTALLYDGQIYGTPPQKGNLTMVQTAQNDCGGTWSESFYSYDDWGNQTSVTDPNGNTTLTTYDTNGNWPSLYAYPESITTPPNGSGTSFRTEYTWDKYLGQVTSVTDPNGVVTNYEYDQWGRQWKEWLPGNGNASTTIYQYHNYDSNTQTPFRVSVAKRTTVGDEGNPGIYKYIGQHTFYDGLGREIQTRSTYINPQNEDKHAVTFTQYNGLGQPSDVYAPIEEEATATYSGGTWDMNRPHTSSSYDALGRVTAVIQPDGTRTEHRYGYVDDNGQRLFWHDTLDGNRHRKQERFDSLGRLVKVIEISGNCGEYWGYDCDTEPYTTIWSVYATTGYSYDVKYQLTDVYDADGNTTSITYDLAGRKISMDDPDMGQWHYDYDAAGNLTQQTDARGQRVCFYYDNLNRLTGKYYQDNETCAPTPEYDVTYEYDAFDPVAGQYGKGQRTKMYDSGSETSWVYDKRGRITSELKEIDGHEFATAFSYDALDRVRTMTYPADDEGNLGEVVTYYYDDLHQANLITVASDIGSGTAYANNMTYNVYGQLTSFEHRRSTPIVREYEYYDLNTQGGLGRLQKIMTTAPNQEIRQHLEYSYDAVGNVKTIHDFTIDDEEPLNVQTQTFNYDHLDRLSTAQATGGGNGTYQSDYKYNQSGNLIEKEGIGQGYFSADHPAAVTHLGYPLTIRAKGIASSGVWPLMRVYVNQELISERTINTSDYFNYQMNAVIKAGDEVAVVFANDNGPRDLFVDWIRYQDQTYQSEASGVIYDRGDPFDNVDVIAGQEAMYWGGGLRFTISNREADFEYDANGNMTKYVTPWNADFNLTYNAENQLASRTSTDNQISRSFSYDGSAQRVKTVTTYSGSGFTIYYIGNYMEFLVSTSGWTGMVKTYYANGKILATRDANNELGYILDDHLSSSSVMLDYDGEVWGWGRYMPYGDKRAGSGRQPHRQFTGQLNDDDGFYFYGSRYYIPEIGRFAQPDSIVPEPGNPQAWNRYSYVYNNPLRYTDPTGFFTKDEIMASLTDQYGANEAEYIWELWSQDTAWMWALYQAEDGSDIWASIGDRRGRFEVIGNRIYIVEERLDGQRDAQLDLWTYQGRGGYLLRKDDYKPQPGGPCFRRACTQPVYNYDENGHIHAGEPLLGVRIVHWEENLFGIPQPSNYIVGNPGVIPAPWEPNTIFQSDAVTVGSNYGPLGTLVTAVNTADVFFKLIVVWDWLPAGTSADSIWPNSLPPGFE